MLTPPADALNHAGGLAYALTPRQALAQLAATGTFNATFYASGDEQLALIHRLALEVEPEFVAKTAIYAWEKGFMKDMPAFLVALLSTMHGEHFSKAFARVATNGKMLRNVVQILRSGATGRKSLGSRPKRLIAAWLESASDREIMRAAVGNDPSLADVIKMVHPKPGSKAREALYGWLIGRPYDVAALPESAREFEAFKRDPSLPVPDAPFQMLTALPLSREHWVAIARKAGWQMLRQNLNTFARHGVFEVEGFAEELAGKLADADAVRRAKAFPYQLMAAFNSCDARVPAVVREALQDAMQAALANVPTLAGAVVICPDVSGSMRSPVTGQRRGATTAVRCIDVAALVTSAFVSRNAGARVMPFEQGLVEIAINPRDSVMTNAARLAAIGGGGTNCSAPVLKLIEERAKVDLVIFVSDNESWVDGIGASRNGPGLMTAWNELKALNPKARLVCLDIQPHATTQAKSRVDILNIGGFSDAVFRTIGAFAGNALGPDHWVAEIEAIEL
jgi:60 kDa SS-A/Ro ribonucleoprotein